MPTSKTATLSSLLVAKKGPEPPKPQHPGLEQAQTPTHTPNQTPAHTPAQPRPKTSLALHAEADPPEPPLEPGAPYYKALTLKVDKPRFTRLKALGVQRNLRSQALLTEALDLLLSRHRV